MGEDKPESDRLGQGEIKQPASSERSQVMTPKEAAKYLGLHLITIYRLLKKRGIPATKIGGQWRFKKDVIDAWLLNRMSNNK